MRRGLVIALSVALAGCGPALGASPDPARAAPSLAVTCDGAIPTSIADAPPVPGDDPLASRGELVGCAHEAQLTPAQLDAHARRSGAAPRRDPSSGARVLRIAYRTTRSDLAAGGDLAAIATARVILPDALAATPSPIVVVAHGTVGLADRCAPSRAPLSADVLALPWAARGWPVIAPDYAGLGSEGAQGYGDGDDTARSVLDAARALRALLPSRVLSDAIVLTGHSQGGGAVLSAQAIERRYGAGGTLALVVPIAPGWPVSVRADAFRDPTVRTFGERSLDAVIGALFLYAWHARRYGDEHAGDAFPLEHRADVVRALERGCIGSLLGSIPRAAPSVGALIDEPLRAGLLACVDGNGLGCTGRARELHAWMVANVLRGDPSGAPIHILVGADDAVIPPSRARCIADHLLADDVPAHTCVLPGSHLSIVPTATARAIELAESTLAGSPAPSCEMDALPPCTPAQ